jgi:hypothetical protein
LSSAILYVAIVAIWAGVLIPRWLRRDSAASGRDSEDVTTAETQPKAEAEVAEEPAPAPAPRRREGRREDGARSEARLESPARPARPARREELPAAERPAPARPAPRAETREETPAEVSRGGPLDQEHKKVLSARRRLLGMLLVLAIASGALAFTKMAAWWVVVPPTIMLLGYLALLYEAGRADAERRELARTRATAAAAAAVAAAKPAAPPAPAAPAPAPEAEVIDISASLTVAGHKFYDQYADAKRRAVGD